MQLTLEKHGFACTGPLTHTSLSGSAVGPWCLRVSHLTIRPMAIENSFFHILDWFASQWHVPDQREKILVWIRGGWNLQMQRAYWRVKSYRHVSDCWCGGRRF